jgi:hypothetical protein
MVLGVGAPTKGKYDGDGGGNRCHRERRLTPTAG